VPEQRLRASGMIPGGLQTPINTGQNRTSNRFRTGRNDNRQERRRNRANFNKFLGRFPGSIRIDLICRVHVGNECKIDPTNATQKRSSDLCWHIFSFPLDRPSGHTMIL
jgi:hypothetical protein